MKTFVRCKDCKFVDRVSDPMQVGTKVFYCHFNPPTPIMGPAALGQSMMAGMFPPVAPDGWCGFGEKEVITQ